MSRFTLIETTSDQEGLVTQVLVLPESIYTRVTDGETKGHQFAWHHAASQTIPSVADFIIGEDSFEAVDGALIPWGETMLRIAQVKFTETDRKLVSIGSVGSTAVKAIRALTETNAVIFDPDSLAEAVEYPDGFHKSVLIEDEEAVITEADNNVQNTEEVTAVIESTDVDSLDAALTDTPELVVEDIEAEPVLIEESIEDVIEELEKNIQAMDDEPKVQEVSEVMEVVEHITIGYVPDKSISDSYIEQTVNGVPIHTLMEQAMENDDSIRLEGPTGCGKSMSGKAFAAKMGYKYYNVSMSVDALPATLLGSMKDLGVFVNGIITEAVLSSQQRPTVLSIEELTLAHMRVMGPLYPIFNREEREIRLLELDGRVYRAGSFKEGGGLLIIASMNNGYQGTVELNEAIRRRFNHVVHMSYDRNVEEQLVKSAALLDLAYMIRTGGGGSTSGEFRTDVATEWLVDFERFANNPKLGLLYAMGNFRDHFHADEVPKAWPLIQRVESKLRRDFKFEIAEEDVMAGLDDLVVLLDDEK